MDKEKNKNNDDNLSLNINNDKKLTPYKCPVCEGRGVVPFGFYDYSNKFKTINDIETEIPIEMCRTCIGKGIIWG